MTVKVTVVSTSKNRVSINNPQRAEIRTVGIIPSIPLVNSLRGLVDVNASNLANNNTIVYDSASDKFIVKELSVLNGGTF
jgi:hypothetical protein